jgi:ABC-type sugar transport system permease subunit
MVSPMVLVNIIYSIVDFFMRSDSDVMTKISETMIIKMDYGFSSAMAWVYFVAVMLIIAVFSLITSRWVYYYE